MCFYMESYVPTLCALYRLVRTIVRGSDINAVREKYERKMTNGSKSITFEGRHFLLFFFFFYIIIIVISVFRDRIRIAIILFLG